MSFGDFFQDPFGSEPPFEDDSFPDNQLGDPSFADDDSYISDFSTSLSGDLVPIDSYTDPHPEENAPQLEAPIASMPAPVNFNVPTNPIRRTVNTRCHLKLPKRIPPPPPGFKTNAPSFLPPLAHSTFYPFDSLNDAKVFIAHHNNPQEDTWVCVPINFINRFRNDRLNEQKLYGYLIKSKS